MSVIASVEGNNPANDVYIESLNINHVVTLFSCSNEKRKHA